MMDISEAKALPNVEAIRIDGEEVFTNVLGYADLDMRRMMVCGIIARRSSMDYVLPALHAGKHLTFQKRALYSLGQKRYVGKKGSLADGVQCVMVIPNPVRVASSEEEDKEAEQVKTVIWHQSESQDTARIWAALVHKTPIPLLDAWQKPLLELLGHTEHLDQLRADKGLTAKNVERITRIQFPVGGDDWGGVVLRADDDDIAMGTQHLLHTGAIAL